VVFKKKTHNKNVFSSAVANKSDFKFPSIYFRFPHKAAFELQLNEKKPKNKIGYIFRDYQIK